MYPCKNKKAFNGVFSEINDETIVLNDALTEFHEENFMRLRYFQEFVKMR
jgi:hypothetical protein